MKKKIKKVLLLGSGALKIGEAGEFDYSGSQAIKALQEEGISVILVNPNIATNQTSETLADRIYFLPVTPQFVADIIKKERPDGILLGFGGQTALNCGIALARRGILKRLKVAVLGTPISAIEQTEDRGLFVKELAKINIATPKSSAVYSLRQALAAARAIGYPVMVRTAYSLGGRGSGVAWTSAQLTQLAKKNLIAGGQALIEEYLGGWKEIEYEIIRDHFNNTIAVCNMENIDPMGIHTGESIVVAPSQTLDNFQYHVLRQAAITVINHLGIIGECNIQFALDPHSNDFRVIEVNARLSRSSALASKATGYPLAFVAAKLALGHSLVNLKNAVNKTTTACFEPALDYVVVKMPRWDLKKFRRVSLVIGSEMKSVGEVMAIGRTFEEALQKAVRMVAGGEQELGTNGFGTRQRLLIAIKKPTPDRIFAVADALARGVGVQAIYRLSHIDVWFLYKIKNIVDMRTMLKRNRLNQSLLRIAKQHGFSDQAIANLSGKTETAIRVLRQRLGIMPYVKRIDTLAAEYPAKTNYVYLTYNAIRHDAIFSPTRPIMVLGSGPYCIGSSVEFDWCTVNAATALRCNGYRTIMVNCNPETVSTDYDECDTLYFEELTTERILDIYQLEHCRGVIVSMGGQIPNNLALSLAARRVHILGTAAVDIDRAEDRQKFSELLDRLDIAQPAWRECASVTQAIKFIREVGYPVLVRPSYVLSGAAMSIAFTQHDLRRYLSKAAQVSVSHPVVVSKFISGAKEIEFDAVANRGKLIHWYVSEHIENAGVHSGDATIVFPSQQVYADTVSKIRDVGSQIARALNITGPFNIQFLAKHNTVLVIECNIRASRTLPFVSKIARINLVSQSISAIIGKNITAVKQSLPKDLVGIKAPQFSFSRLAGADPILTVEMSSTGEVVGLGNTVTEALLKAMMATGFVLPKKNILLSLGGDKNKVEFLPYARMLIVRGYRLYATPRTAEYLSSHGIRVTRIYKVSTAQPPNVAHYLENKKIDLVINTSDEEFIKQITDDYLMRRLAVDFNIPLLTNIHLASLFIEAICTVSYRDLKIKAWDEYY